MLIFDSRFESGNLRKASKVNNVEYNLWLDNDINTKGHTQWFYYKVVYRNEKQSTIKFSILNLAKSYSLYKVGMKPMVFSLNEFKKANPDHQGPVDPSEHKEHWQRAGDKIEYFQNKIPRYETNSK